MKKIIGRIGQAVFGTLTVICAAITLCAVFFPFAIIMGAPTWLFGLLYSLSEGLANDRELRLVFASYLPRGSGFGLNRGIPGVPEPGRGNEFVWDEYNAKVRARKQRRRQALGF